MIYLDSAILEEARTAVAMGWVRGITTNPTLLGKSDRPAEECLQQLNFLLLISYSLLPTSYFNTQSKYRLVSIKT